MATTPRGYPYPQLTDAPAGPTQMQSLAQAVDTDVQAIADQRTPTAIIKLGRSSALVEPVANITPDPVTSYDEGILVHVDDTNVFALSGAADGGIVVAFDAEIEWFATFVWDAVPGGTPAHIRSLSLWKNGVQTSHQNGRSDIPWPAGAWSSWAHTTSGKVQCAAGDKVQLVAYQSSGAEIDGTAVLFGLELKALL